MHRVVLAVCLFACTNRTSIRHAGSEIGEPGTLRLRTGEERRVSFVGYVPQGLVVDDGYRRWTAAYEHVDSLEYTSHAGGAWQGLKYGALIGGLIGLAWGAAIPVEEDDIFLDDRDEAVAFGTIMFGFTGVVFGTVIGAIKGRTDVYAVDER
jgi:tetrahydromethanopterin S-methyltransferase subunit F